MGTVAANVLEHGTGALNIDGCRVAHDEPEGRPSTGMHGRRAGIMGETVERHRETTSANTSGRWPANVVLDESQAAAFEESRFFYVAKAPKSERPVVDGVAHPTVKPVSLMQWLVRLVTPPGGTVLEPFAGSGTTVEAAMREGFNVVAV
ncbi:DNA methyltransferase, partial [Bacillus sp. 5001]|uniref:DNA methyltransferase n=1 Tax=Bacillus sp. 5001 TaxID=3118199 RepID=UPI002F3114CB